MGSFPNNVCSVHQIHQERNLNPKVIRQHARALSGSFALPFLTIRVIPSASKAVGPS